MSDKVDLGASGTIYIKGDKLPSVEELVEAVNKSGGTHYFDLTLAGPEVRNFFNANRVMIERQILALRQSKEGPRDKSVTNDELMTYLKAIDAKLDRILRFVK